MKKLELTWKSNVDGCGVHTFTQVKRTDTVAMYQRVDKNGITHSWEVFRIPVLPKGHVCFKAVTDDDTEVYGKNPKKRFGKYSLYSCQSLARAEHYYDLLVKGINQEDLVEEEDEDSIPGAKTNQGDSSGTGKRSRKAIDRSTVKIPQDKFTMKQLELANPEMSFAFLYQHLRTLLDLEYHVVDKVRGGRGKPTLVYAPMSHPVSNDLSDIVTEKLNG